MKKIGLVTAACAVASIALAAVVTDDFNDGNLDGWSKNWSPVAYDAEAGSGVGGSGAMDMANTADSNQGIIYNQGVTAAPGEDILMSGWFQMSWTATPLNDETAPNVNGVNKTFAGVRISDTASWWDGNNAGYELVRRDSPTQVAFGLKLPISPWVDGWVNGWAMGGDGTPGVASSSGWVKMELLLTEGGGGTYEKTATLFDAAGNPAYTTPATSTTIAHGSTVYGGFWNGWDGGSLLNKSKIDDLNIDDYRLETIPEPATLALLGLAGAALYIRRKII